MLSEQVIIEIKDILAWLLPSILGVATLLAFKSSTEKITFRRIIRALIIGIFIGYGADTFCSKYNILLIRGFLIAVSGMISESILQFFFKNDSKIFKSMILRIFNIDIDKNKKNENTP